MCSQTPRFSYGWSKTAVPSMPSTGGMVRAVRGTGWDGYTGGCRGGVIPVHPSTLLEGGAQNQRSGPAASCREAEWWVLGAGTPADHPCGARSVLRPSLSAPRAHAASGPIRARIQLNYTKVSQNRGVSPEMSQKACHSPCSQNGARKSPLEILRFPFFVAFSHKELSGHFDA